MAALRPPHVVLVLGVAVVSAACASGSSLGPPQAFPAVASPAPTRLRLDGPSPVPLARGEVLIGTALELQGTPYLAGGDDPDTGFDCSGFVRYVFGVHHVWLPRTVAEQYRSGVKVNPKRPRAGDLVFFSTTAPGPTHVGIALGDGEFVHAPGRSSVVRIDRLDTAYWQQRFIAAKRLF